MKINKTIKNFFVSFYYVHILNLKKSINRVTCPFCNWEGNEFLPQGIITRKNAKCPKCKSLERHRLYFLYLKKLLDSLEGKPLKLLHFAPETILTELFKSYPNIDYLSVDLDPTKAMKKEDITELSFKDNSFDMIFCSHVLEHIVEDIQAMQELHRVLKPSGFAILQVPMMNKRKIFEDSSIIDPKQREKFFGQDDHVRKYGKKGYLQRLKKAGFKVKVISFLETLTAEEVRKHALKQEDIYYCTK